jgi:hypothetical protein
MNKKLNGLKEYRYNTLLYDTKVVQKRIAL